MLRRWREKRAASKRRKRRGFADPAEAQRVRDEQSPFKAKWGFFPK